jgi:hypothetical protein
LGDEQTFNVRNVKEDRYDSIKARMVAENDVCMVYVELDGKNLTVDEATAQKIAAEYKAHIHSQITGAFGSIKHLTANNKVTFLLVDIQDFYEERGTGVAGYFSPNDMLSKSVAPYSNERDMLFIDTNPTLQRPDSLYATMAHELQHLINFSQTTAKNGGHNMDTWVNEGLSTSAEYIYGKNTAPYVKYYSDEEYTSIRYGNNFFVWNGMWENGGFKEDGEEIYDTFGNYSTVYLFFQWLRIQAGTRSIYNDIIAYGAQGITDYRSVTKAARTRIPNLLLSSKERGDWETLLRTWMAANMIQADTGVF